MTFDVPTLVTLGLAGVAATLLLVRNGATF
jgi:hypothetical protein